RLLELGPDGVLCAMAAQCIDGELEEQALLVPGLRKDRPEVEALTAFLAAAHVHGVKLDWAALFAGRGARTVDLPTYAFQRRRYWLEPPATAGVLRAGGHPLLSAELRLAPRDEWLFMGRLSLQSHAWIADHV